MIVKEIKGDLLDTHIKNIAQGVNCQGAMGSGVAKAIMTKYPDVRESYINFHKHILPTLINGTEDLLGVVQPVQVEDGKTVYNLFTQDDYGYDGKLYLDIQALYDCFTNLIKMGVKEIAIPRIGCGLAGGDWESVKTIINVATQDNLDVYVYVK